MGYCHSVFSLSRVEIELFISLEWVEKGNRNQSRVFGGGKTAWAERIFWTDRNVLCLVWGTGT
jgi:hypothetical protein